MTTYDEAVSKAASEMAKEIDQVMLENVLSTGLVKKGWTMAKVAPPWMVVEKVQWQTNTAEWCHRSCTGDYKFLLSRWWFERGEDATAFTLKWA